MNRDLHSSPRRAFSKTYPRAAAVLVDEFYAGAIKRLLHRIDSYD